MEIAPNDITALLQALYWFVGLCVTCHWVYSTTVHLKTAQRQTLRAQDYAVLQLPIAVAPRIDRTPPGEIDIEVV